MVCVSLLCLQITPLPQTVSASEFVIYQINYYQALASLLLSRHLLFVHAC